MNLLSRAISTGEPPPSQQEILHRDAPMSEMFSKQIAYNTSFKDTLLLNTMAATDEMELEDEAPSEDENNHLTVKGKDAIPSIYLTQEIKARIRKSWKKALIIKAIGAKFSVNRISPRLTGIWRPKGKMDIIDLSNGFYTVTFSAEEDYWKALEQGPWFIGINYLAVQPWTPNFDPNTKSISSMAVWIRLNALPLEYFDK
ncbi:hypothetical protein RJ639_027697 [Escallonia herrerae]|uniref:DUF4283 domain-containing protein n=1 Tax=Escallonia herrerae TaxID=1293975 RepID=A0AA89BG26_9ASTE|nr:hypothetical protein RJ639_027697 [Escallonia herrerae]